MDQSTIARIAMIIVAVCLVVIGGSVFFDPIFVAKNYGIRINFGAHHELIGIAIVVIGILLSWRALSADRN